VAAEPRDERAETGIERDTAVPETAQHALTAPRRRLLIAIIGVVRIAADMAFAEAFRPYQFPRRRLARDRRGLAAGLLRRRTLARDLARRREIVLIVAHENLLKKPLR